MSDAPAPETRTPFPLQDLQAMDIVQPAPGHAVGTMAVDARHHNPFGLVHGGMVFTLVDTVMGAATVGVIEPGTTCATIEIQLRFLRPVVDTTLRCDVHVLRAGRRVVHLDAKVHDAEDRMVAAATGSFAVVSGGAT